MSVPWRAALAAAGLLLQSCGGVGGAQGSGPSAFVPATVEEALRELRHTQARDGDWRGFGEFSSVTLHKHGRTGDGEYDEEVMQAITDAGPDGVTFEFPGVPGAPRLKAVLDDPDFDAADARPAGSETLAIRGRSVDTRIYEFVRRSAAPSGGVLITTHRFWLAAGIPTGVARHDSFQVESGENGDKPSARGTTRLTDLDLPFRVAGNTLHCYCYESELRLRGGEVQRSRYCKNAAVPGGIVKYETVHDDGLRETGRGTVEVTDFESHPLGRSP